jgi:hypothetical protein
LKQELLREVTKTTRELQLQTAQHQLNKQKNELIELEQRSFWRKLIPNLAGGVVALFYTLMLVLMLKILLFDGIVNGFGLNRLTRFVTTLVRTHPFGGSVLAIIELVLIVGVVLGCFWAMVKAVSYLNDWDAEKLMFWRRDRY